MSVPSIILASTSKYRRELLQRLIPQFECRAPGVDEDSFRAPGVLPQTLAGILATAKAEAVSASNPDAIVIGSDQLVDLDGEILGKPGSEDGAVQQLMEMSGRSHRLITAVCVVSPDVQYDVVHFTTLTMRSLSEAEIRRYVNHDQPLDCAGSYKIESLGISLFERIETTDFTSIMGLPLISLSRHLRSLGISVP